MAIGSQTYSWYIMYEADATTTPMIATQLAIIGKKMACVSADFGLLRYRVKSGLEGISISS